MIRPAQAYAPGHADAPALVLAEPLSFWGGVDVETGQIIDRSHADLDRNVAGTILVMPGGRGSSSSSAVLAEAIRRGTAPAAIILAIPDPILPVGAIVAQTLYGVECPIVVCDIDGIATGDRIVVRADKSGSAEVEDLETRDQEIRRS